MKKVTKISETATEIYYPSILDMMKDVNDAKKINENAPAPWHDELANHNTVNGFIYFRTYDEAENALLKGDWRTGIEKLNKAFRVENTNLDERKRVKAFYDVVGHQASIPRYLQGLPQNMINNKVVMEKEKVVTVVKHIGFRASVSVQKIIENSAKALAVLNRIEQMGIRCNLNIYSPAEEYGTGIIRIRIKNATERFSVGKLAFPLANPDMLRRFIFLLRLYNTYKGDWRHFSLRSNTYGRTIYDIETNKKNLEAVGMKNCIFLNNFIDSPEEELRRNGMIK